MTQNPTGLFRLVRPAAAPELAAITDVRLAADVPALLDAGARSNAARQHVGPDAVAGLYAQAGSRADRLDRDRAVGLALQRALPATSPRSVPGLTVRSRCVPAGGQDVAGGDFLEVLPLSNGRVALMLGDVAGHGTDAAGGMAVVSSTLRAYALDGHDPCRVVQCTNSALMAHADPPLVTCCYGDLDLDDGLLRVVLAGHLPPLLLRAQGTAEYLTLPPGLPLGVERGVDYGERGVRLAPGDALLLCTDGLVESRRTSVDDGLAALLAAAQALGTSDLDRLVDEVLDAVRPADSRDDVAVLVLRYDGSTGC